MHSGLSGLGIITDQVPPAALHVERLGRTYYAGEALRVPCAPVQELR